MQCKLSCCCCTYIWSFNEKQQDDLRSSPLPHFANVVLCGCKNNCFYLITKTMKLLKASFRDQNSSDIAAVSAQLDKLELNAIEYVPWPDFPYRPKVHFAIAHDSNNILLKYYVEEKSIRAATGVINGPVWEDACVEFFVAFDESGYYNLEFNCIGTALVGFGPEKTTRELLSADVVERIQSHTVITKENENVQWQITLIIPTEVFIHHSFSSLRGMTCRANFYKCGDALPQPHFLAWSNIECPEPNFHLPQFFGELQFQQ